MFSYVAKSLLSKTLRAFLRKYLENIELEGINYGSSSSSADASGSSGWGVRLSNVKLREGMELVKLPGKRKRVVTRKKRLKRNLDKCSPVDTDNAPRHKNSISAMNLDGREVSVVLLPIAISGVENVSVCEENTSSIIQEAAESIHHQDCSSSFDTEDDEYFSSNPTTPNQSRHGFCGVASSPFCRNSYDRKTVDSQKETAVSSFALPFGGDQLHVAEPKPIADLSESCTKNTLDFNPNIPPTLPPGPAMVPSSRDELESRHFETDKYDDNDDDSFIEVEEEFVVEEELALCVGAGGSIGILNIRMVGGELHVTVEDAHLTIEAVPVNESCFDEGNETGKSPQKSNFERSTSTSNAPETPTLADKNKESKMGEKIQKKSLLARCLSMIPHLFLRDCKVSLLLPAEMGEDGNVYDDDCTVFEFGIEFLSVTSGDDFLDVLRYHSGNQTSEGPQAPNQRWGCRQSSSVESETPSSNSEGRNDHVFGNNLFARKRIRTGKGPEGGVWLRIHPPLGKMMPPHRVKHPSEPRWAMTRFVDSSESFFFRCSGFDLHARMLVDIVEDDIIDEIGNAWSNDEYDDYTMDSMLFGVDYVDPISLTRHQIKAKMKRDQISKPLSSDDVNNTDKNGIQSIPYASNFHWIAQRAHRSECTSCHLPLNECFYCWNECVHQKPITDSPMNEQMPLPGFVFCLSMSDPLEVNVDRNSLEALGYLKSLLISTNGQSSEKMENPHHQKTEDVNAINIVSGRYIDDVPNKMSSWDFDDKSFPPFMQPDAIHLASLHVSKLIVRVEVIQPRLHSSLRFRYWEFVGQSIQLEQSQVDADEHFLRDVTFHVGSMECKDFTGVCERNLFRAGIDTSTTADTRRSEGEVLLPCTASRVLGVSYPTANKPLTSYAVLLRLIQSDFPEESASTSGVGYVNLRMGTVDIEVNDTLVGDISKASNEATSILFHSGSKTSDVEKPIHDSKSTLKWLCQVSTVGGTISYQPIIKMKIPWSKFRVMSGSEGISFESVLHKLGIEYGTYMFERAEKPSIIPLCDLSESLRMHILLYLDDLTSLEKVLNIKKKKSSAFLRSHVVNKKLSNLGATLPTEKARCPTKISRRNNALFRLESLDIDSLEALLAMHEHSLNSFGGSPKMLS